MEEVASSSLVAELRDLASLYQKELLTLAEYTAAKQQVLGLEPRARERETEPENDDEDEVREINENFTKYARCYHCGPRWEKWKGTGEGRKVVEQAMDEILKTDKYIGFSHNEIKNSVYLIRGRDWNGIDDESIRCESRPVPKGLTHKNSFRWKWHSLYIKK